MRKSHVSCTWLSGLCLTLLLLAVPVNSFAQIVNNPSTIEYLASPTHAAVTTEVTVSTSGTVMPIGSPLLTSYQVNIVPASGGFPVKTTDIGKPAPVSGKITFTGLASVYAGLPVCPFVGAALTACYTATVQARGPGGLSSATPSSDPFSLGTPLSPTAAPDVPAGKPVIR